MSNVLHKVRFTKENIGHLIDIIKAKLQKKSYAKLIGKYFKTQSGATQKTLQVAVSDLSKTDLRELMKHLKDHAEHVQDIKCSVCKNTITGMSIVEDNKPVHIFCAIKPSEEKDEPVEEEDKTKKTTQKSSDDGSVFRPGSKYEYVYSLLQKSITFDALQKNIKEKFGSITASKHNVNVYIHLIGKKVKVTKDGDEYTAK